MTSKYTYLIIALIAVGAIFYFNSSNKAQAPTADNINSNTVVGTAAATSTSQAKIGTTAKKPASKPLASTPVTTKDGTYIVSYLNSGFTPKTLEIKRGTSVRFINNSSRSMRVATTDTTGNSVYQSFSQPKTVGNGGYFDYTFNDPGTYNYANQFNTDAKGTVVVK